MAAYQTEREKRSNEECFAFFPNKLGSKCGKYFSRSNWLKRDIETLNIQFLKILFMVLAHQERVRSEASEVFMKGNG